MHHITTLYLLFVLAFISCDTNNTSDESKKNEPKKDLVQLPFSQYKILKIEPLETSTKAQVVSYAYLTSDTVSEEYLSGTLINIYDTLKNYKYFKKFSSPSVIVIYLFTSKEKGTNMPESWIAMLNKTPSDNQPQVRFNKLQLNAFTDLTDNNKSEDEKKLDEINSYLSKRNTDLCFIYKTLYDLELETIKQADKKYPDFGIKHNEYQSKLYDDGKDKLFTKYHINDTLSTYITVFGMTYCK